MTYSGPDNGILSVVSSKRNATDQELTKGVNEDPQVFNRDPPTTVVDSLPTSSPKSCASSQEEEASTGKSTISNCSETESLMDRPKRPLSAYNLFFRDQRELMLMSLPQYKSNGRGHGKISFQDLAKNIGAKWKDVDPQEKARYETIASQGREKYRKTVEEWKQQQRANGLPIKSKKKVKRKVSSDSLSSKNVPTQYQSSYMQNTTYAFSHGDLPIMPIHPHRGNTRFAAERCHEAAQGRNVFAATSDSDRFPEERIPFGSYDTFQDQAMSYANQGSNNYVNQGLTSWEAGMTEDPLPTHSARPMHELLQSGAHIVTSENLAAYEPIPIKMNHSMHWSEPYDNPTGPCNTFTFIHDDISDTFDGDVVDPIPFPTHLAFCDGYL